MFRLGDATRVVEDPVLSRAEKVPFGDDITVHKGTGVGRVAAIRAATARSPRSGVGGSAEASTGRVFPDHSSLG